MKNARKNYWYAGIAALLLLTRLGLGTMFTSASDITPESISAGVNNERTSRNISSLSYNAKLAAAAAYKAQDMVTRNYFAHVDPDGHYIWDKDAQEGYTPYSVLGENLAINFPDTAGLMSAWMDSPEHRANILNGAFQDQGAGVTAGNVSQGQFSIAIANEFGALVLTPKPTPAAPPPAPKPTPVAEPKPTPKPAVPTPVQPPVPSQLPPSIAVTGSTQTGEVPAGGKVPAGGNGSTVNLSGKTEPNSHLTISDTSFPNVGRAEVTSDGAGNFAYQFTNLQNGTHTFVAVLADGSATSAAYSVVVSPSSPAAAQATAALNAVTIDASSLQLHATALPTSTALDVSINVSGNVQTMNASVGGQSAALVRTSATGTGGMATYAGTILFDTHASFAGQSLVLGATDSSGKETSISTPLGSVPVQQVPGAAAVRNTDLYGVFKDIAIVFGILFALFLIGDLVHSTRNRKMTADDVIRGSHVAVLLIAVGTMLVVSWWH